MMKHLLRTFASTGKSRMIYLLAVLVSFVVLDGLVTEFLVDGGLAREGNPLLEPLVGEAGFMMVKVAGAALCAFILWDVYRRLPRLAVAATWCFVGVYGVILAWNASFFIA